MNYASDGGRTPSATWGSSPWSLKQTSLLLYRLKTSQKETGLGEGAEKDADFALVSGSGP